MATILTFEPLPRAPAKPGTAREPASKVALGKVALGEVIIFPGVRLEREGFKLSDRLPDPDKPGMKRRRQSKK